MPILNSLPFDDQFRSAAAETARSPESAESLLPWKSDTVILIVPEAPAAGMDFKSILTDGTVESSRSTSAASAVLLLTFSKLWILPLLNPSQER